MPRNNRRSAAGPSAATLEVVDGQSIPSPLNIPEDMRDPYWNGLLQDPDALRAAIGTVEFFPLLKALPKALWDSRLLIYLYRTAPKVKNQAGDKSYIDKITHPIDEDWIKENHGGGSYLCYLNMDRDTRLKQYSFSIDAPMKPLNGQMFVDGAGNVIPISQPAPAAQPSSTQSEVAQAIAATSEAQRIGMEVIAKGTEQALELQNKVMEKSLGISGNGREDKLFELLITSLKPAGDPTLTALTLLEKIESIAAKRNPQPEPAQPATPLSETLAVVNELTGGTSLPDLLKGTAGRRGPDNEWISVAIGAGTKLIENLPNILAQVFANQERNFQRQLYLAQLRAGQQPPALPGTTGVVTSVTPPGARVAAPPPAPFVPAVPEIPATTQPSDPASSVPAMVALIRDKFTSGYSGAAVAQALDVLYPDLLEMIAPTVLDETELRKFLSAIPELIPCIATPEWAEFEADFVSFVRDEFSDQITPEDQPVKKPVMPAANA